MKVVNEYPPNIEEIKKVFPLDDDGIIFAYGNTIYAPKVDNILDHFIKHEEVHQKQQGENVEEWWEQYLADPQFRLQQEIEAYRVQYAYIKPLIRTLKQAWLHKFAKDLSGKMYGKLITFQKAKEIIKNAI